MKKTKVKILDAALKCFNEQGVVNVRLQHIADEAFIRVGNLTYHFSNKEAIVLALYQQISEAQKASLFKLSHHQSVIAPFDDVGELCHFIQQDIQLNE
ncbi:MAG: TetR/AcrR family transcriptional regulator [Bacteroidota bacterium]